MAAIDRRVGYIFLGFLALLAVAISVTTFRSYAKNV